MISDEADCIDSLQSLRQFCSKRRKKFTVSVEGNIGCGKTTLIDYFDSHPNVEAVKEPVEQWTNVKGHNALELMYGDPARWTFSFNNYAFLTRLEMHKKNAALPVRMLERSLFSTRYIFVENSHRSNQLTSLELAVLDEWFYHIISNQNVNVDLFVYLRASPEVCYERIKHRARKEEALIPFKFIEDLHNLHEKWLIEQIQFPCPAPVLILDASHDLPKMRDVYEEHKTEILCGCA